MLDQKQPNTLHPVEGKSARVRPQRNLTPNDVDHVISASELTLADRQTWEDFWSNLLGEYEHLGLDMAEAA